MPYDRLRIVPERVAKDIMKKLHFDDLKRRQFTGVAKENKAPDADLPYLRKIYEEHGMPPPNDLSPIVRVRPINSYAFVQPTNTISQPTGPAEGSYVRVKAARAARAKAAAVKAARAEAAAAEADEANKDEEMVDADEDNEADEMDVDDKKVEDSEVLPSRDEESD